MSEEILLRPSFDKLTEKLDNTQEYEDWLLIQEYIDKLRKENKKLHLRDTYTNITHNQFQLEKKEKRYYENIFNELEKWLEEEKQLNGDVKMKISDISIAILRKINELKGSDK